ncbi:MAG: glycoside hydrolase family 9 protein [Bacteroidales bacterium]|nr:glycoside hydrolase family 9 protein [Bacteroidales bacterium]
MKRLLTFAAVLAALVSPQILNATKLLGVKTIDKDYIMVHFRDGEVRYRDDATGPSAYLGHTFVEGDDTLFVFGQRLDAAVAGNAAKWVISSKDDRSFGTRSAVAAWRKSKPMNTDNTLTSELDHWIFLQLPKSMKQGCTYTVSIPEGIGADASVADLTFDIWSSVSEAVHVNIIGYSPEEETKAADLYLWLGDGGQRDYSSFEGNKVWLYNVRTGKKQKAGKVDFWMSAASSGNEANKKNMTGSDVWNIDFKDAESGRYRLVVEDVGCSMDFDISNDIYFQPYHYSLRGYYYMRLGEPIDPRITPVPRQPQFIPGENPEGLVIYKTDMHPWHPDWRKLRGDVWDEPHFKLPQESEFWKHRLPGNPVNEIVRGGHSDAMDWDRHLAHVSNIYDLLLPYILTGGRLSEDNLSIRESGNGIPDLLDEARNEVDFFLSIRDGEAYSQGVTNPSSDWTVMYQAGCTTMAAWANAANCAMLAEAFRIHGNKALCDYYTAEAVKAFRFAEKQEVSQLDDRQNIGTSSMRGRDFKQMAAAFIYNLTGDREWEDIMVAESVVKDGVAPLFSKGREQYYQIWGAAAYLTCPQERHYPEYYVDLVESVNRQADENNVCHMSTRPSRRTANDPRWQTSENLQMVLLAHYVADTDQRREQLEQAMYIEAGWGLGRNPSNTVEMTGLGERHIIDCYTTGRNDGVPGSHPGQTPFNGTETWSPGNGGDARIILGRCYPDWYTGGWPHQESFFNIRYMWVNGEFTPRETMRGKMALLAYLYGIRK